MTLVKCPCCGNPVDLDAQEVYPYDDDKIDNTEPGDTLLMIDAQPAHRHGGFGGGQPFRILFLCYHCWHRLEGDNGPDMWTTEEAWEELNPYTPFDKMPPYSARKFLDRTSTITGERIPDWDPKSYVEFLEPADIRISEGG